METHCFQSVVIALSFPFDCTKNRVTFVTESVTGKDMFLSIFVPDVELPSLRIRRVSSVRIVEPCVGYTGQDDQLFEAIRFLKLREIHLAASASRGCLVTRCVESVRVVGPELNFLEVGDVQNCFNDLEMPAPIIHAIGLPVNYLDCFCEFSSSLKTRFRNSRLALLGSKCLVVSSRDPSDGVCCQLIHILILLNSAHTGHSLSTFVRGTRYFAAKKLL